MSNEERFEKALKYTKISCILFGILFTIALFTSLSQKAYTKVIFLLAIIVLLFAMYFLIKKKNIAGPILGIILGIVYICAAFYGLTIFSLILGILVIISSVLMLICIKIKGL